jgi:hypothetical protein
VITFENVAHQCISFIRDASHWLKRDHVSKSALGSATSPPCPNAFIHFTRSSPPGDQTLTVVCYVSAIREPWTCGSLHPCEGTADRSSSSGIANANTEGYRLQLETQLSPNELTITNDSWQHRSHAAMKAQGGGSGETRKCDVREPKDRVLC